MSSEGPVDYEGYMKLAKLAELLDIRKLYTDCYCKVSLKCYFQFKVRKFNPTKIRYSKVHAARKHAN